MRRWLLGLVIPLLASACYTRRQLDTLGPAPGSTVRVALRPDAAPRLMALIGPDASAVDGRVLAGPPDTLLLGVTRVLRRNERTEAWRGERVALARSWVASVEGRRLSMSRTALLAAGFVAVVVVIGRSVSTDLPNPNRCTVNC